MASFTEQATLLLKDSSTPEIKKINAALKELFKTAKSLKSVKIDIDAGGRGLTKAQADIRKLTADLGRLTGISRAISTTARGRSRSRIQP